MSTSPLKFHITNMNLIHSYMYDECVAFVKHGLESNGYEVTHENNKIVPDAINIVFGAFGLLTNWTELSAQAKDIILYNWEPASPMIARFNQNCIRLMRHTHVWDYSVKNIKELKEVAGVNDIHLLPFGYIPQMSTIVPQEDEDIDVFFYGYMHERRRQVVRQLREKGLHVVSTDDVGEVIGEARDALIRRSKVLLNIHAFDFVHIFEIARVSYWLANKKAIVTEVSDQTDIDEDLKEAVAHGSIDQLADICYDLIENTEKRKALAQKGYDIFTRRNAADLMRHAVERYLKQSRSEPRLIGNRPDSVIPLPRMALIGSGSTSLITGHQWRYSHCNIDARADYAPDVVLDLSHILPFGRILPSWRFGQFELKRGCFNHIIAHDFFQRVINLKQALTNCLELLEDGGTLELTVPLDLSYESWSHANDRRLFNDQTWSKILDRWWEYNWNTHRFEISSTAYGIQVHNHFAGEFLGQNNNDWGLGARTPRVIDIQTLTLRKRVLTDDEFKQLPQARFMD